MQRHRSHGGGGGPVDSKSTVMTRSRSHSASSSRSTNTGSSSSGSSSSGSSSSSSSGSGSDSSSSDAEGSQASKGSQQSRASRSSQTRNASSVKSAVSSNSGGRQVPTKVQLPTSSSSSSSKKKNGVPVSSQSKSVAPQKASGSQSQTQSKNEKSRVVTSGTVKNIKPQAITKMVQRTFNRRNGLIGSSSESESSSALTTPVKRVGSKPVAVSIITSKSPVRVTSGSSKKKPVSSSNSNHGSSSKHSSKKTGRAGEAVTSTTKSTGNKKLMKTIFSPDNTSDSEVEKRPPPKKSSVVNPKKVLPSKEKPSSTDKDKKSSKGPPPVPNAVSSSSLSASETGTSSNTSTTGSSSDSSSESEKKPDNPKLESQTSRKGGVSSPKSPSSSARKRPVTRRQRRTVPSKTIPTTTTFIQSELVQPPPQLTLWDSDYSASDEHESRSHARVPAKGSHKTKPRATDEEEDMMERERKCPFPCCDSSGHLSGKFPTHTMLSTCPKYQGFSPEECKENAEERESRENERLKYFNASQPHQKKPSKLSTDAKNWVSRMKDLKERQTKDGLCSEYDMTLWVDSLAGAAAKIETEQAAGISYRSVAVGKFEMSCWCDSPYPAPLNQSRRLFICEFCLKPVQSGTVLRRHCAKCVWRHPPGDEIYRKDRLSVWEVDGKNQKTYCQNLCLLAKCFLDHKTLYVDVDPFLFYVMTLADSQGCHLVGYFSKEKNSFLNYNVSCILTLPPYQRQGFGRLLIDFSYLLTRVEGKVGSPEKPLSDLGLISYRSYWKDAVLCRMCSCATREMIVKDLSIELGVTSADLISTLQFLGMLKYWKGKHIVLKKQDVLEEYTERLRKKGETRQIDPTMLRWRPYQPPVEASS